MDFGRVSQTQYRTTNLSSVTRIKKLCEYLIYRYKILANKYREVKVLAEGVSLIKYCSGTYSEFPSNWEAYT